MMHLTRSGSVGAHLNVATCIASGHVAEGAAGRGAPHDLQCRHSLLAAHVHGIKAGMPATGSLVQAHTPPTPRSPGRGTAARTAWHWGSKAPADWARCCRSQSTTTPTRCHRQRWSPLRSSTEVCTCMHARTVWASRLQCGFSTASAAAATHVPWSHGSGRACTLSDWPGAPPGSCWQAAAGPQHVPG